MKIRFMEKSDLERVVYLENESFSKPWSRKSFLDAISSPDTLYLVAETESGVTGYCGFFLSYETADLCNMLVEKQMRGKGTGRRLLEEAFTLLEKRQVEHVMLEVRESNASAIGLYEKMGFEKFGIRKGYYSEPLENAVLMKKNLLSFQ